MHETIHQLDDFRVSEQFGFLAPQPLPKPTTNLEWHQLAADLPKILTTDQFSRRLQALPPFALAAEPKYAAAIEVDMRCLSYLGHALLWRSEKVPTTIPRFLAKPWCEAAKLAGRPPVLSYASYCLANWSLVDDQRPAELGNINIISNFLGGIDEDWFILVHVDIEASAAKGLAVIPALLQSASDAHIDSVVMHLNSIYESLLNINRTMNRMPEHCDPYVYYTRVRPYIFGSKNNPALPNGLIYEDCFDNQPQFFRGETGAQSSIVPALDGLLGIGHKDDPLKSYLMEMRDYMVPAHRLFIETIEQKSKLRALVQENKDHKALVEIYNNCVNQVFLFRETHIRYASEYIHRQATQNNNSTSVGTGGTPFMEYLAKHRDETTIHLVQ